jgi:hypothetical protein
MGLLVPVEIIFSFETTNLSEDAFESEATSPVLVIVDADEMSWASR